MLRDIELLTEPTMQTSGDFSWLPWLGLFLIGLLIAGLVFGLRRSRLARVVRLWRFKRQLRQGADVKALAVQLYVWLDKQSIPLNAQQQALLNQACFSPSGVSRETLIHWLDELGAGT